MARDAVVFTGGDAPGAASVTELPEERFVVAADSGLAHAMTLGVAVDLAVGDFDSVAADVLRSAERAGAHVERHPAEKDQTDLELALDAAVASGAKRVIVIGGQGGRIDHWLGNIAILASQRYAQVRIEARSGRARLFVVRDRVEVVGEPAEYVTLLAWNEPAQGVRTTGLRWPLDNARLDVGTSLGVSNELLGSTATVELASGVVLVILPGEHADRAGRRAE